MFYLYYIAPFVTKLNPPCRFYKSLQTFSFLYNKELRSVFSTTVEKFFPPSSNQPVVQSSWASQHMVLLPLEKYYLILPGHMDTGGRGQYSDWLLHTSVQCGGVCTAQ